MFLLLVAVVGLVGSNSPHPPQPHTADDCDLMDVVKDGMAPPLHPMDDSSDMVDNFDVCSSMEKMDNKDCDDFETIKLILYPNKKKRAANIYTAGMAGNAMRVCWSQLDSSIADSECQRITSTFSLMKFATASQLLISCIQQTLWVETNQSILS